MAVPTLHDFQLRELEGEHRKLSDFAGKVCLVVNVASECGLTPQYDGLQRLYAEHCEAGFEILAFPCNQFGGQEPAGDAEIGKFCRKEFGVEFSLFGKIDVTGDQQEPLYAWLTSEETAPEPAGEIAWNFSKFLVGREGQVIARFAPAVEPCNADVKGLIEEALKKP